MLIILLKMILKLNQVITANHANRLVRAKVWIEFARRQLQSLIFFSFLPQYLSSYSSAPRQTLSSTSSARLINENSQINKQAEQLFERETVKNLLELQEKIKCESLPCGFVYVKEGSSIFYHYIKSSNQPLNSLKLLGTVIVTDKHEVQMFISFAPIPRSSYNH